MIRRIVIVQVHYMGKVANLEAQEALRCFKIPHIRIDLRYSSDARRVFEGYICNQLSCYLILDSHLRGASREQQLYHGFHPSLDIRLMLSFLVLENFTRKILFQDSKTYTCLCTLKNKIFLINFIIKR